MASQIEMCQRHDFVQRNFAAFQARPCRNMESHVLLVCMLVLDPARLHQPIAKSYE